MHQHTRHVITQNESSRNHGLKIDPTVANRDYQPVTWMVAEALAGRH